MFLLLSFSLVEQITWAPIVILRGDLNRYRSFKRNSTYVLVALTNYHAVLLLVEDIHTAANRDVFKINITIKTFILIHF